MSPPSTRCTILFTADLHGRVSPFDPFTGTEFPGGLARTATILAQRRRDAPGAILLDLGDLVQGTPFAYLPIATGVPDPHPMIRLLNRLGYEGMVVGNHEFNYGFEWIRDARRASRFPWLAANVLGPDGRLVFEPVLRLERDGKKIAILAITTPQVPRWEAPRHIEGLEFVDAVETARVWVPRLRREADAVVIAAHMGWTGVTDGGLELPTPPENDVERLAAQVDGIDAILMAHTHETIPLRRGALGTPAMQAGANGRALGELTLAWNGGAPGKREPAGSVAAKGAPAERGAGAPSPPPVVSTRVHETGTATPPDPAILEDAAPDEERARVWVETVVGEAAAAFTTTGARYRDNDVVAFIHGAQREFSGADLSSAALFFADRPLAAGPIRILDLYRIYPFENFLTVVELAVDDVRDYLEQIARIYVAPARDGRPPAIDARVSLYNHDSLAGCEYVLDPGRPSGSRVVHLAFEGGELPGSRRLTLAVSSYRACGGGGYEALRRARLVEMTRAEIRGLLVDTVRRRGRVAPERADNWRVVGAS